MSAETVRDLIAAGVLRVEDGNHGNDRPRPEEFVEHGVAFIRAADMTSGVVDFARAGKINSTARARIRKGVGARGDVILSHKGTVGRIAVAPDDAPEFVCSPQTTFWRSLDHDRLHPRFLQYVMLGAPFQRQLGMLAGQTDMAPYVSLTDQRSMTLDVPDIGEQRAIAEVLGALDDKIAANNRLVDCVDEVVGARFERLTIGAGSTSLAALGRVNVAQVRPVFGDRIRYLDISAVNVGSYELPPTIGWEDAPGRARRALRFGDTIWSTVRPNRRSHALVLDRLDDLVASTGLAVLTPHPRRVAGLYESTRMPRFGAYLESVAEGSAYPAVRADRFLSAPVPDLPGDVWEDFESVAMPMRLRSQAAIEESRALARVRNELLPLLMSSKVHVRDAAVAVEEVL